MPCRSWPRLSPVSTGTQLAGASPFGHVPVALTWYGVTQPFAISSRKLTLRSQSTAWFWLPLPLASRSRTTGSLVSAAACRPFTAPIVTRRSGVVPSAKALEPEESGGSPTWTSRSGFVSSAR